MLEGLATTPFPFAPVPLNRSARFAFDASLVMVPPPCIKPTAVGEKDTSMATLCPPSTVKGKLKFGRLNSDPLRLIADTVTLVCPVFANTKTCVCVCPVGTEPKGRLDGVHVSCRVPVPANKGSVMLKQAIVKVEKARMEKCRRMKWGSFMPTV
jgi:hypothetical protein